MTTFKVGKSSSQQLRIPTRNQEMIRLVQLYVSIQGGLPSADRFPGLAMIQARLAAAEAANLAAITLEANRSAVSNDEEKAYEQAAAMVRKIIAGLRYVHLTELPVLEQWGINVVHRSRGYTTQTPQTKTAVIAMLDRYINKENTLPPDQRLADPKLSEVTAVRDALSQAIAGRRLAKSGRERQVEQRLGEVDILYDMMQVAAAYHIVFDFGGIIDTRLQTLGFDLVGIDRSAKNNAANH